jgi:hypothetical protein
MAIITRKFLLLLLFACTSCLLHAQAKLAIDSASTIPADTVEWNGGTYLLRYQMVVVNVGNNVLNGHVNILCRYNGDTIDWKVAEFDAVNFEVGSSQFIDYYDTITTIAPSGNRYKGGDNIIVIWPKSENLSVQAPDTNTQEVYIRDLLASSPDRTEILARIALWPNPVANTLHLDYTKDAHKLECVRVTSLNGQVIQRRVDAVEELDFSNLPSGLYLVDVRYRDGVWGTFRVMHEN